MDKFYARLVFMLMIIMHPRRGPKGQGVADRQRGGALVFLQEFSVLISILHIVQFTKGSYSLLQLLHVNTGYYRLLKSLQVTTSYYKLLLVTTGYYNLLL